MVVDSFPLLSYTPKKKKNYSYKENRALVAPALTSAKRVFLIGLAATQAILTGDYIRKIPGRDGQILYLLPSNNAATTDLALDFKSR